MTRNIRTLTHTPGYGAGAYVLFGATGIILAALAFEHIGGYAPCPMCLMQRWAYYAAIPLSFAALILMSAGARVPAGLLMLVTGLAFLANAVLGGYQAGAEWGFWPGPATCGSGTMQPLTPLGSDFAETLRKTAVPSCTDPDFRFLGLSFAGWNVVTSALLSGLSFYATSMAVDPALQTE